MDDKKMDDPAAQTKRQSPKDLNGSTPGKRKVNDSMLG